MMLNGVFITLEGVEGVGKSSAMQFLANYFDTLSTDYVLTREPGGTEIAEAIRKLALTSYQESMCADTELLLMFASRAQHIAAVIRPALAQGKIVLSDRFTDATYAYQGGGRGIAPQRISLLEQWVQDELQPDLTLLLDAPTEIGLQRIHTRESKDRIEQEQIIFFQQVRQCYLQRAAQFSHRFRIIDATQSLDQVHTALQETIASFLSTKRVRSV